MDLLQSAHVGTLCRLFAAEVFLLAGTSKLLDSAGFRESLARLGIPAASRRLLVRLIPGFELVCGVALLMDKEPRFFGMAASLALRRTDW